MHKKGIILIHGLGGTPTEMKYVGNQLEKKGIAVKYCVLSGHCSSLEDLRKSNRQQWINSVNRCYDEFSRECEQIYVAGLSAGCLLALNLAVRRNIAGVICYAPAFVLNGWSMPFYMPWLRYMHPWMDFFKLSLKERYPYGLKDERIRNLVTSQMDKNNPSEAGSFYTPLQTMLQFNRLSIEVEKKLHKINVPILSIHSIEDDVSDISNSYKLYSANSNYIDICKIEDSFHIITLDKQKDFVCEKTARFILNT